MRRTRFTLIELLASVVLAALLVGALMTVFAKTLSLRDSQARQREDRLLRQRCLDILRRDLGNLPLPGGLFVTPLSVTVKESGDGRQDILDYVTATNPGGAAAQSGGEWVSVELRVEDGEDGRPSLVRVAQTNLYSQTTEEAEPVVLMADVVSFSCRTCVDGSWQDGWTSSSSTSTSASSSSSSASVPAAVELTIVTKTQSFKVLVPSWVGGMSSSSSSSSSGSSSGS